MKMHFIFLTTLVLSSSIAPFALDTDTVFDWFDSTITEKNLVSAPAKTITQIISTVTYLQQTLTDARMQANYDTTQLSTNAFLIQKQLQQFYAAIIGSSGFFNAHTQRLYHNCITYISRYETTQNTTRELYKPFLFPLALFQLQLCAYTTGAYDKKQNPILFTQQFEENITYLAKHERQAPASDPLTPLPHTLEIIARAKTTAMDVANATTLPASTQIDSIAASIDDITKKLGGLNHLPETIANSRAAKHALYFGYTAGSLIITGLALHTVKKGAEAYKAFASNNNTTN